MLRRTTILELVYVITSLAFTFDDSLAVIVDHYEGGEREYYDTDNPHAQGCESTTMICNFLPPTSTSNNATSAGGPSDTMIPTNNSGLSPPSSSPQNRINWGEICMNPLVDYVITEPCSTLTSPDGYILTPEGERVLKCLAGGALVGILQPELLVQIRELGPAVGCAG